MEEKNRQCYSCWGKVTQKLAQFMCKNCGECSYISCNKCSDGASYVPWKTPDDKFRAHEKVPCKACMGLVD